MPSKWESKPWRELRALLAEGAACVWLEWQGSWSVQQREQCRGWRVMKSERDRGQVAQILESRLLLHSMWAQGHAALLIRTCRRTFDFLSHHLFQVQMKDFRFSYKFKMACKEDVLKLCPNIKKKYVAFNWFVLLPNMSGDLLHSGRIGPGGLLYTALVVWLAHLLSG